MSEGEALARLRETLVRRGACPQCADDVIAWLRERYAEPHRHYHNMPHVLMILDAVRELDPTSDQNELDALELASWFHDAIYDTHAEDNEDRSAEAARELLTKAGLPDELVSRVADLVMYTKGHRCPARDSVGAAFLDADLRSLAVPKSQFDGFSQAIRKEFDWVPEPEYRAERVRLLRGFFERNKLYCTETAREQWEESARKNLHSEINRLSS